ncbi:MAG: PEP-CTERM sorting domain-containing protein [Desulforegulaceae bacterium]|nr:PEP-CTERM sorting domain-containing protein [Desulforegulaceae bacterium]
MKKNILFLLCIMFSIFLCTSVYAFSISLPQGPINIKANVYSIGTDYSNENDLTNPAFTGPDFGFNYGGSGTGGTNTYGLISITSIQIDSNNDGGWENYWSQTTGEWIVGYFWGLSDNELFATDSGYTVNEVGGYVNLYKSTTGLDIATGPTVTPDYDGLTDLEMPDWTVWNATGDNNLWLSADFTPGVVIGDTYTTYTEDINGLTFPYSGSSNAFLDVTGGSMMTALDSDAMPTGIGTFADLDMNVVITGNATPSGWNIGEDPINATVVPEPSTLIFFGLGLLGFAGLARKKILNK